MTGFTSEPVTGIKSESLTTFIGIGTSRLWLLKDGLQRCGGSWGLSKLNSVSLVMYGQGQAPTLHGKPHDRRN